MSPYFPRLIPLVSLIALAVAAGVGWRSSLKSTFGWSILSLPVFLLLFIVWVALVAPVRRRIMHACVLLGFSVVATIYTFFLLAKWFSEVSYSRMCAFIADPFAVPSFAIGEAEFIESAVMLGWGLIPLSFCLITRAFGTPFNRGHVLVSIGLFILSWPMSLVASRFLEADGGTDFVYALTSGFVVPFLVFSLGYPLLFSMPQPVPEHVNSLGK